ncbi:uncharacterized protein V6R79_026390 [Siganus canaliculatus]
MADMETRGLYCLGSVLLLVLFNYAAAQETPSYFKVGSELTLTPGTFSQELSSILWKNAGSLVADWVKDKGELTFYKTYKGRTQLDIKTGVLTIRDMRSEDAGLFTVEINSQVLGKSFRAEAVVDLKEPRVWIRPLTCGPSVETCTMTCETDTTQAGPVTYTWKGGDQVLPQKTMKVEITKAEMKRFETFTCLVENPVSKNESKPKSNPLYEEPPPDEDDGGDGGNIVGGVVGGVLGGGIFLALVGLGYWKRDDILKWLGGPCWSPVSPEESPPNGNLDPPPSKNTKEVNIQMEPATDRTPDPSNKDDLGDNKPPEDSGPPPEVSASPPVDSAPPSVDSGPRPEDSAPPQSSVDASAP